ncbi:cytochrome c [bacterium]|nr:cytochrome c [bacterium]
MPHSQFDAIITYVAKTSYFNLQDRPMFKIFFGILCIFFVLNAQDMVDKQISQEIQKPQDPISVCTPCHGSDGNNINPTIPRLAGQYQSYLATQLYEFKKGEQGLRYNTLMYPIAQALTDKNIESLAEYYAQQKKVPSQAEKRNDLRLGERIYKGGIAQKNITACSACHSPTGAGNDLYKVPSLAGQHSEYISIQLKNYRDGARKHPVMSSVAHRLSDVEIAAVSNYLQGLTANTTQ